MAETWQDELLTFQEAGVPGPVIEQERLRIDEEMRNGGVPLEVRDEYFGKVKFDDTPVREAFGPYFKPELDTVTQQPKEAKSILEGLEAGWKMSNLGLIMEGKTPDMVLQEDPDMFISIASQVGTMAGDLPSMIGGYIAGGWAGGAAAGSMSGNPVVAAGGALIGAGALSNAAPEMLRKLLMDNYANGGAKDFRELWANVSASLLQRDTWERTGKAALLGGATMGVGAGILAKVAGPTAVAKAALSKSPLTALQGSVGFGTRASAQASEVAAMVVLGSALEGQMPSMQSFTEAAVLVTGLGLAGKGAGVVTDGFVRAPTKRKSVAQVEAKLRDVYAKANIRPEEAITMAKDNPLMLQELLAENGTPEKLVSIATDLPPGVATPDVDVVAPSSIIDAFKDQPVLTRLFNEKGAIEFDLDFLKPKEPKAPPVRTEAQQKILAKIAVPTDEKPDFSFTSASKAFRRDYIDRLYPIDDLMKERGRDSRGVPIDQNAYRISRMAGDAPAKSLMFLKHFTFDRETLKKTGDSFDTVLSKVDDHDLLNATLAARRTVGFELTGKFKDTKATPVRDKYGAKQLDEDGNVIKQKRGAGFDVDASRQVLKEVGPEYIKAAKEMTEYRERVTEYARKAGLLEDSPEAKVLMKIMNLAYVDFQRLFKEEDGSVSTKGGKHSSLKNLKGVQDDVLTQSPILSVANSTIDLVRRSEINIARKAISNELKLAADPELYTEVPARTKVTKANVEELQNFFEKNGVDLIDEDGNPVSTEALTAFELYRREMKQSVAENEYDYYDNGKRVIVRTTVEMANIVKSLEGSPAVTSVFMEMAQAMTGFKKAAVSITPEFQTSNLFRDQIMSSVYDSKWRLPFVGVADAMMSLFKKDESWQKWMMSGGANGSFIDVNKIVKNDLLKLHQETNYLAGVKNAVLTPIRFMQVTGAMIENASRLADFKRRTKDATTGADFREAGFHTSESTLDFRKMGLKVQAWNSMTAFMGVGINGIDRTVQAFKDNPKHLVGKGLAYITAPSVALWIANHDEDWYKGVPQWEKDAFWHFKVGDTVHRLAKPMELGIIFGSIPERILELTLKDNPRALKGLTQTVFGSLFPTIMPDFAAPVIEQIGNFKFFTGGPIVSLQHESRLPEDQVSEYTSESAKGIAKAMNALGVGSIGSEKAKLSSPLVIDNYLQQVGAGGWRYLSFAIDQSLRKSGVVEDSGPALELSDIPFVRAYVSKYPNSSDQRIKDFSKEYGDALKVFNSLRLRAEDPEAQAALIEKYGEPIGKLDGVKRGLEEGRANIRGVYKNKDMSKDEKRESINNFLRDMIEASKAGLEVIDETRKSMEKELKK